jgi:hypothetical protein
MFSVNWSMRAVSLTHVFRQLVDAGRELTHVLRQLVDPGTPPFHILGQATDLLSQSVRPFGRLPDGLSQFPNEGRQGEEFVRQDHSPDLLIKLRVRPQKP